MKVLLCLLISVFLPVQASENISKLKNLLGQREQIPKLYLPQQVIEGQEIEVLVLALGAKSVRISASRNQEESITLAESELDPSGRASFKLSPPPKTKASENPKAPDLLFLEALLTYPSGETKTALVFGSNAADQGFNAVQVVQASKDNSAAANMARSFIPGMAGLATGNY